MDFRNGPKRLENLRSLSERSPSHTSTKNVDIPSFTFVHPTILTVQCRKELDLDLDLLAAFFC